MPFNTDISSLYIHVPFCNSKCSYCDFFSVDTSDYSLQKNIVNQTIKQAEYFSSIHDFSNIETVYIGGGTPTSLPLNLLEKLIINISNLIKSEIREFTIEINPETVDEEMILFFQNMPLTRLSTGIQTFSDKNLKILGRKSSSEICLKALELLKKTDCEINVDLISSIPGQKSEECIDDIRKAQGFDISHISLYNLTIEENTPISSLYNNTDIDDETWTSSMEFLIKSGFDHYEISNFSKNNKKCLHNMNYWEMKPYIGCGPAAVSTVYENNSALRLINTSNLSYFLDGINKKWNQKEERISRNDFFIETLMMGFRTSDGIKNEKICEYFGYDIYGIIPETIIKWTKKEMLLKSDTGLSLTEKGRLFHSSFIIDIMNELEKRKIQLS